MKYLYMNKYWEINKDYNIDKLLYIMIDRPNESNKHNFIWNNIKDQYYRNYDLPSFVSYHNYGMCINLYWFINNNSHREKSKPAIVYHDGSKTYWTNDIFVKNELPIK